MNRLLLIPFIAVSAGFAALVIVNANPSEKELIAGSPSGAMEGGLPVIAAIEDSLIAKWDELTPQPYMFSRVLRPQHQYSKPEIFVDWECPETQQIYVGRIRLTRSDVDFAATKSHEDFAMIVDRKSCETTVYWENQWISFDQWVTSLDL